jgi:hypothetical protein
VTLPTGVSSVWTCSGEVKLQGGVARTERRTLVARWGCEDGEARWGGGVGEDGEANTSGWAARTEWRPVVARWGGEVGRQGRRGEQ